MVIYDSWLAKKLLKHPLGTMMLFGIIFTKVNEKTVKASPRMRSIMLEQHCYVQQFVECALLASPVSLFFLLTFHWWIPMLLMPTMFYIVYLIDYCIKYIWCYHKYRNFPVSIDVYARAYTAFAMEAEEYKDDMFLGLDYIWNEDGFIPPRTTFGWIKYLSYRP